MGPLAGEDMEKSSPQTVWMGVHIGATALKEEVVHTLPTCKSEYLGEAFAASTSRYALHSIHFLGQQMLSVLRIARPNAPDHCSFIVWKEPTIY